MQHITYTVEYPDGHQSSHDANLGEEFEIDAGASSASWVSLNSDGSVDGGGNDYSYEASLEPGKVYVVEDNGNGGCYPEVKDEMEE